MLHCLNTSGNLGGSCSDMTVLERQRARKKWQQQEQQEQVYFCGNGFSNPQGLVMMAAGGGGDSALGEVVAHSMKPDPGLENGWPELGRFGSPPAFGFDNVNSTISRTCSGGLDTELVSECGTVETFRKRKADHKAQNLKVVAESDNNKRIRVSAEEGESKITEQTGNKNNAKSNANKNNKETSADTSKENSKGSEVQNQKPDYIHVRARRGQATDSHSLAERVRREKISERMKYLQDLVPGCNKITGKAGMLDEIINYVQSLQRQVEFLSMKLAAVNPRLDFNIDELFAKEVFPACAQSFPTIGMQSSDMINPAAYLQFNSAQQLVSCCGGLINNMGIIPPDVGLRRNISSSTPVSLPETFLDSSCFTHILSSSTWEDDFQNLHHSVAFDQERTTTTASFPSQPFTGMVEASNLKMEM